MNGVDTLNKNLCDLFNDPAANSDMVKLCGQHKTRNTCMHDKGKAKKQKWFYSNCKISGKAYHKAKHNYNVCKSSNNKSFYVCLAKNTKMLYEMLLGNMKKGLIRNFVYLSQQIKTKFWKLLCTNDEKKSSDKINLDVLSNYFSQLNKDENVYDVNEVDRATDHTAFENAYLNEPFSEDEVMAVLSQLKCGKAAGPDLLINDFFLNTHVLLRVLC